MNEFLKGILDGINSIIGNYGWSVVVFTLLIRLVIMPFDYKSRVSMRKTQKIQPQLNALQKKYANDKEKLNKKMTELYQKEKINPLSSCLPMLLTMPILFAMFAAMRMVAGENMAAQVFTLLQGEEPVLEGWLWIKNIWMPDSPFAPVLPDLYNLQMVEANHWLSAFNALGESAANLPIALTADSFSNANIKATIEMINAHLQTMPAYVEATSTLPGWSFNLWIAQLDVMKNFNGFLILPVMSMLTQMLMTKVQPVSAPAEGQNNQQQSTGAFMKWFFPIFSLVICFSYNAIFAIYWVAANIIATAQNVLINWYLDKKDKEATAVEGPVK